ncbi:cytochrome P450 [Actinomadura graeca]|uniref:Cytochrome P450 n=1 Tax=Actinomadura graeca TaxID=2750812 RepID=A0ABX8QR20_9ACTN|nr:cytochrome P450 [Actinomadura graeca]QXJ21235.1 cytochrome P450 [Actinomadura graeca]
MDDVLSGNPAALACPAGVYDRARQRGVHFSAAMDAWVVSAHDDVLRVVLDAEAFSSDNALGAPAPGPETEMSNYLPYLLTLGDPEHARRRAIVNRAFTPRRVAEHEPAIREICRRLVDGLRPRQEIDFVGGIAIPLPISAIMRVLGLPDEDLPDLLRWSQELVVATVGVREFDPDRIVPPGRPLAARLARRLKDARHGVLAVIARSGIPPDDAARFVIDLLVAGNFTTTAYLTSAAHALARSPALADRLRAHPGEIPGFVEETLRLENPLQGLYRRATRDCEINGVPIAAGARVLVLFGSANLDPARWPDPVALDPGRTDATGHLTFGHGPHTCLGSSLVRTQSRLLLEVLLAETTLLRPAAEEIDYLPNPIFRSPTALRMRISWRTPAANRG